MRKEAEIYLEAHNAGIIAGQRHTPQPMIVTWTDSNNQPQREVVSDGLCGFAWIKIHPARGKFVKFLKNNNIGRKSQFETGYTIWVNEFNQSHERKLAYAQAFSEVLRKNNIDAYPQSRLD